MFLVTDENMGLCLYIHANPWFLGGLFANGKDSGRCLPMLNR